MIREIPPRSGVAFTLDRGQRLTVIDPQGEQVADLLAFSRADIDEVISSGRTLDYVSRLFLTVGDPIYRKRSRSAKGRQESWMAPHSVGADNAALLDLARALRTSGYKFVTITPASH